MIDNKRIAKNTLILYLRMAISMIVNLYTIRVVWDVLGIDNYGIYNLVGGIVLVFQFINNAMVSSTQRFISFELGTGDFSRLNKVFSVSVKVHWQIAGIILLLAETVGLWFLNYKLNIPTDKFFAANCVYQCSIFAFLVTVISVPYNACIVAHEHMKIYGYYGILEIALKFGIALLLIVIPFDKLITYALLVLCVQIFMRLLYQFYCRRHFEECVFRPCHEKELSRSMFAFAGWSFIGNMGFSFRDQGLNILLNLFFNVAMNAAKGVANQATAAINGFATNFTMALNPQITKSYAAGDTEGMLRLMFRGCKFAFLLLSVVVIPIAISADKVLYYWLGNADTYAIGFLRILLLAVLVDSMVSPITTAIQATQHIKIFQIAIAVIMIGCLPFAWLWLKIAPNPYSVAWISLITSIIALATRLYILRSLIPFSMTDFLRRVILPCGLFLAIASVLSIFIYTYSLFSQNLLSLILFFAISVIISGMSAFVSLDKTERKSIKNVILKRIHIR